MLDWATLEDLARKFFRKPNALHWDAIQAKKIDSSLMERLSPWLKRLESRADPVILPFTQKGAPGSIWYVGSTDPRTFRHSREHLKSFLGGSYSDFTGQPTHLDPSFEPEAALIEVFGRSVFRVRIPKEHAAIGRQRLELLASLLDETPVRTEQLRRPAGRVLADFEEAIRRGDQSTATLLLEELERDGHLDAQNLLYLRIRRDELKRAWDSILDLAEQFNVVTAARRPRLVGKAILRAAHANHLKQFELAQDASGALREFREHFAPAYGPLLTTRSAFRCAEADAVWLLRDVSDAQSRSDIDLNKYGLEETNPWAVALLETLEEVKSSAAAPSPTEPTDRLQIATLAFGSGDLDGAWEILLSLRVSVPVVVLTVRCAYELDTLQAAQVALEIFDALDTDTRAHIESRNRVMERIAHFRGLASPSPDEASEESIPSCWADWLDAIAANPKWPEAPAVAEKGELDWTSDEFGGASSAARFSAAVRRITESAYPAIREALPYLLRSMGRCRAISRSLGDALSALVDIHTYDDARGRLFFGTLADLYDLRFGVGLDAEEYRRLLQDSGEIVSSGVAPSDLDGLLDVLDVLVSHPQPDPTQRTATASIIANQFVILRQRASDIQLPLLRQLLREAGCDVPTPLLESEHDETADGPSPLAAFAGMSIALYSLHESVLHRASIFLHANVDSVRVKTFHDKAGGGSALRQAARNADVFVVATAAAKHAATEFIEAERSTGQVILRPDGKGLASMVRTLEEYGAELSRSRPAA